jgi:hypothetical protein
MKKNIRFENDKYFRLSELGSKFSLSFSSYIVVTNKIIALDGLKKKLLISETKKNLNRSYIIDLNKVTAVSIKNNYSSIKPGELKEKQFEEFLETIDLHFECDNKGGEYVVTFYDRQADDFRELDRLERNAKNWQIILSKLVGPEMNNVINAEAPVFTRA